MYMLKEDNRRELLTEDTYRQSQKEISHIKLCNILKDDIV